MKVNRVLKTKINKKFCIVITYLVEVIFVRLILIFKVLEREIQIYFMISSDNYRYDDTFTRMKMGALMDALHA